MEIICINFNSHVREMDLPVLKNYAIYVAMYTLLVYTYHVSYSLICTAYFTYTFMIVCHHYTQS